MSAAAEFHGKKESGSEVMLMRSVSVEFSDLQEKRKIEETMAVIVKSIFFILNSYCLVLFIFLVYEK